MQLDGKFLVWTMGIEWYIPISIVISVTFFLFNLFLINDVLRDLSLNRFFFLLVFFLYLM